MTENSLQKPGSFNSKAYPMILQQNQEKKEGPLLESNQVVLKLEIKYLTNRLRGQLYYSLIVSQYKSRKVSCCSLSNEEKHKDFSSSYSIFIPPKSKDFSWDWCIEDFLSKKSKSLDWKTPSKLSAREEGKSQNWARKFVIVFLKIYSVKIVKKIWKCFPKKKLI